MNTAPIVPAALAFDDDGVPFSARYDDIYHPRAGALTQARHVFLGGNELPRRWQGRERFVVLETGFGLGNNFLATWQAWRDDPQRCARLCFISIEQHPLTRADLGAVHRDSPLIELAEALQQVWPPLTANLHRLDFDGARVQLLLALGDVQAWLPELVASVDAFYLDGFAPAANPRMWDERVCKALGRLAAPHATLATWSAARGLRDRLTTAGFEVRLGAGTGGKRDITLARFAPGFTPRRAIGRQRADEATIDRHALIVGGGLAGCATAWALAEQGWSSTVLERRTRLADEASGNPAGLFHGIVNAQDGLHARFNRAAALSARHSVMVAIDRHGVPGNASGLLRLETAITVADMQSMLDRLGLPPDYVQALDAETASERAAMPLSHPAWFYPDGGWVQPAGLARAFLERAAPSAQLRTEVEVHALRREGNHWRALDARGETIAESRTIVLANAADALRLLGGPAWPIESIRGQLSMIDRPAATFPRPRLPIAGSGYLLPAIDGRAIFGATAQVADDDGSVRMADHRLNVAQLERLAGLPIDLDLDLEQLNGRVAWRFSSQDRLPVIGAVPDPAPPAASRLDQPRFVPRLPGLFVFTALGSRGITWSALGAQALAAQVTGAPAPMEASLLDAVDPGRFVSRVARRTAGI